jgi:hypothetical protein
MSGSGGYKHRKIAKKAKRKQAHLKGAANLARVKNQFERKGQSWDPHNNPQQLAALNHDGRRLVGHSAVFQH